MLVLLLPHSIISKTLLVGNDTQVESLAPRPVENDAQSERDPVVCGASLLYYSYIVVLAEGKLLTAASATFCIAHVHCNSINSGLGKREAYIGWYSGSPKKAVPVTQATLRTAGPLPVDSRR